MLRAYCSDWDGSLTAPVLDREEIHHLVRVRRVKRGETVEILNGRGDILVSTVAHVSGKDLELAPVATRREPREPVQRHLLVALPKGKTFPAILQKAVELGVSGISPLVTEHSEVDPFRAGRKSGRWEALLVEAVKQSGNPWLPELGEPLTLEDSLAGQPEGGLRLCAALREDARPLFSILQECRPETGSVSVFVGPEGDFSAREYQFLRESGCHFFTLGPLVLKVDTAAALAMGAIGLWCGGWQ